MINKKIRIHRGSFKMIKRANQKKKKGFSLIELIIVLAVMAIIALIAIPNFTAVRNNSKVKADKQSCETIKRTVLMLTSDESVAVTAETEIEFTPGTPIAADTTTGLDSTEAALITTALAEVKAPQEATKTKYIITINADGSVELPTTN